jgi:PleD family two-component response regulator
VREKAARVAKLTFDDVKMDADEMERDIKEARRALNLFLNSRMLEAEEIMKKYSDRKLYYALGDALIAVIKGFMVCMRARTAPDRS